MRRAKAATSKPSLSATELAAIDAWWRAANYLSVGQIYLLDNPLLQEPLRAEHVKPRLVGHWGTTPGLNFIYAHLNRVIRRNDLDMIYIAGPGHGGPALVANTWLEGSYSERYPDVSQDLEGMRRLFKQFSFPGGIGSHATAEVPGSIHEGGELGYALSHAFGAAFDNPELIVSCVIGDGEAETGALAAAWHSNKFLNPACDGAVLPILHLNGYKIANPTLLARIPHAELEALFVGYGYRPHFVEGDDPAVMHQKMAATLDRVLAEIRSIQRAARSSPEPAPAAIHGETTPSSSGPQPGHPWPGAQERSECHRHSQSASPRPNWPMIVLRSPKGWTGPKQVDGKITENHWRSHQVPVGDAHNKPAHLELLAQWLQSYRPETLFDAQGRPLPELLAQAPSGARRMGANPHANGGEVLRDLRLPDFRDFAVAVPAPGATNAEATRVMGRLLREVMQRNADARNFLVFGPDETASNRLDALFEVTARRWLAEQTDTDDHLSADGRVFEILSEHTCQGWLEGYLLTGRHGFFSCYEAFIHIVDSMFNQHAKWLKVCNEVPWRRPIASLNYLLTSHVWRQDHNGFSHQDPGFIDLVMNKKAEIIRVYLPPDANTLLYVTDKCLHSRNRINVIVAGKQPQAQWLDMASAINHCTAGAGIWQWAGTDHGGEPDVVLACAGDVPTIEVLAAADLLRQHLPELKVRVVNVVDLMTLQSQGEHPHGFSDADFDNLFTTDKPVIFAFHGYPWLIHRLTYRRRNHGNLHVRGYKEEGTTTTPFDMVVINDMDRYHLVADVIDRVPTLGYRAAGLKQHMREQRIRHYHYIREHGEDLPEIRDWTWPHR
jgi:xylulose-5-phosphate/fructose-6-phosphate phosphoketolase